METLDPLGARRLALVRAGLWKRDCVGLPRSGKGRAARARTAAFSLLRHFGYLQLDTVSIVGARSHAIVLLSRFEGMEADLGEQLLCPGTPVFEYWGHEASWLPIELYPYFEFRRKRFREHPWWGDLIGGHPEVADALVRRIREEGPLRSLDMEGRGSRGFWDLKLSRKVAAALWSSGDLAIRERCKFQRTFDLTERVIPDEYRRKTKTFDESLERLLGLALNGHGWATTGTLAATWRLRNCRKPLLAALHRMEESGEIVPCALHSDDGKRTPGWIRTADLELASRLRSARPNGDAAVLLSPFDPLLWERDRVSKLFDFEQILEIFKPAPQRTYGYYCLPVLAGEKLVARVDLKAERKTGHLRVLSFHAEVTGKKREIRKQTRTALDRFALALDLKLVGAPRA